MTEETNNNLIEVGKQKAEKIINPESDNVLKIEISRDHEIERIRDENKNLSLELAKKDWAEKNPFGRPKPPVYGGAPLNEFYSEKLKDNGDLLSREFESEESLYAEVNKIAHSPCHPQHKDALGIEKSLFNQLRKHGIDFEYVGTTDSKGNFSTKSLYKQPIEINPNWTAEQKQTAKNYNSELAKAKSQWRKVE
jgi:hypothetical protein